MFSNSNSKLEATLTMNDGKVISGFLVMGTNATLQALLAYSSPFLELIGTDGQKRFVSKSSVSMVEPIEALRKPVLDPRIQNGTDPFSILKVSSDCDFPAVRKSYLDLAKIYHPDKFAQITLPNEVSTYMSDMFRQINSAFVQAKVELNVQDRDEAA